MPDPHVDIPKPKQRRISRACDYCHRRSIRCKPAEGFSGAGGSSSCQNCKDFAQVCTYHRQPKRRGVPARNGSGGPSANRHVVEGLPDLESSRSPSQGDLRIIPEIQQPGPNANTSPQSQSAWRAPYIVSQATVVDLVELYFEIVYPIFPFFHQPSFTRKISRAEYNTNQSLFATTMAVCALALQRETLPDTFYAEAKRQLLDNGLDNSDFNILRGHAIMAITAIQNGKIRDMHHHLGIYHTFMAMDGLHDEVNWPSGIGIIEREERRRMFWSIYTLDIFTSVVWGGVIRSREQQANVAYPAEVDDHGLSPPIARLVLTAQSDCWLSGWNFITDLYRVLEHALARFRDRRRSFMSEIIDDQSTVTGQSVRDKVLRMYLNLPECFKNTPAMAFNQKQDLFGFQAANITASLQLLRITLFAAGGASIAERCEIASDVVDAFSSIPVQYCLTISKPLLHHLGGIGAILGSVFEEPLSEAEYNRVRSVMLSMARLLENLETIHRSSSASEKLRSQVSRIDEYMAAQRQQSRPPLEDTPVNTTVQQVVPVDSSRGGGQNYEQVGTEMTGDWSFLVPPDLLGDLTWNFDFGGVFT
ncbi:fungal specific transcription factor domain-containing protein [Trichoderma breve]|uniref:Fungal specific transcription factor domain-containing protein n=1 Tax=Trichoderma breve TaxID=2034170 RepID=A0A9W9BJY2_9HYPO|nr:fungal specific transcription factor domain-containing protein [Trichoderma breve]KAJ4861720.1 fungal specific transcription factor domain-containing protein [Trichoderma breve]